MFEAREILVGGLEKTGTASMGVNKENGYKKTVTELAWQPWTK